MPMPWSGSVDVDSSVSTTVRTIRVIRPRFGGSADTGGGGSSGPRRAGGSSVAHHRRSAARRSISSRSGSGAAAEERGDLVGGQLEDLVGRGERARGGEAPARLEERAPEQAGRPLVGERTVLVAQAVGQPRVLDDLVEGRPVRLRDLLAQRGDRVVGAVVAVVAAHGGRADATASSTSGSSLRLRSSRS